MQDIKALLFDLGGVLVDFAGLREIGPLLPEPMEIDAIKQRWITSPSIIAFERGEIGSEEFVTRFIYEWQLKTTPDEFAELFTAWVKGPLPGMSKLLETLKPHFTLACFSNTNALHWDVILNRCNLRNLLQKQYASHLLGAVKPDRQAFQMVCADMQLAPEQVVFFDDIAINVEGAIQAGLHAFQVNGPDQIKNILRERKMVELEL